MSWEHRTDLPTGTGTQARVSWCSTPFEGYTPTHHPRTIITSRPSRMTGVQHCHRFGRQINGNHHHLRVETTVPMFISRHSISILFPSNSATPEHHTASQAEPSLLLRLLARTYDYRRVCVCVRVLLPPIPLPLLLAGNMCPCGVGVSLLLMISPGTTGETRTFGRLH